MIIISKSNKMIILYKIILVFKTSPQFKLIQIQKIWIKLILKKISFLNPIIKRLIKLKNLWVYLILIIN